MTHEIKAVILDVDGVIIGEKVGVNSPHPTQEIIELLKKVQNKGIPISLCTGRPRFAIDKIIKDADLDNVHITDGGGIIIDPLDKIVVKENLLKPEVTAEIINRCIEKNIYTEFYTEEDYFIQKSQENHITTKHARILEKDPIKVENLSEEALKQKIAKIMPIVEDMDGKPTLVKIYESFSMDAVLSWGVHPSVLPLQFGIITAHGISKKQGAIEVSRALNISTDNILAVGDSTTDWQYIGMCGFGGAMGNATQELKDLVLSKGENKSFIGPSVDDNGLIDIFTYFRLI